MNLSTITEHEKWMALAIAEAKKARAIGEVPIGAIIVHNNAIIGRGYNEREHLRSPVAHAEMTAIAEASRHLDAWRLLDCRLYVTLEPCPMCAGAILQARIPLVVYGTADPKAGCAGTLMNLLQEPRFNHRTTVISDVMQPQCSDLLQSFFRQLRQARKARASTCGHDDCSTHVSGEQ